MPADQSPARLPPHALSALTLPVTPDAAANGLPHNHAKESSRYTPHSYALAVQLIRAAVPLLLNHRQHPHLCAAVCLMCRGVEVESPTCTSRSRSPPPPAISDRHLRPCPAESSCGCHVQSACLHDSPDHSPRLSTAPSPAPLRHAHPLLTATSLQTPFTPRAWLPRRHMAQRHGTAFGFTDPRSRESPLPAALPRSVHPAHPGSVSSGKDEAAASEGRGRSERQGGGKRRGWKRRLGCAGAASVKLSGVGGGKGCGWKRRREQDSDGGLRAASEVRDQGRRRVRGRCSGKPGGGKPGGEAGQGAEDTGKNATLDRLLKSSLILLLDGVSLCPFGRSVSYWTA